MRMNRKSLELIWENAIVEIRKYVDDIGDCRKEDWRA
jgi:hypothetical protein